ncbi:Protein unc-50-like protein [Trichoplax sp. H2]|nr:Protein unc-50-like protein [Trichoplax sp. H2]|eukprot:RDD46756.1 Protein unc-50-like protein [Trichoplax sp. H2]
MSFLTVTAFPLDIGKIAETKHQWARDDPAFLVLLAMALCISSIGFAIVLKLNVLAFVKFLFWVIFIDCIGVGLAIGTLLWFITNKYLKEKQSHGSEQSVEWLYSFDVHLNAFFPLLIVLHVVQMIFMPVIIDQPYFISCLIGNSLWLIALIYYNYVTFLGYSALPFLKNTVVILYPVLAFILIYIFSLIFGWNIGKSVMTFYRYRIL